MKFKHIISLLLTLAILISAFSSCNSGYEDDGDESTGEDIVSSEEITEETDPETDPETVPETDPETQPETDPETDPETQPETQPETDPETDPETQPETQPETKPEESGSLDMPDETTDPEESGSFGDPEIPVKPDKVKPENPKKTLYQKSTELYSDGKLGSKTITILAKYNNGIDFNVKGYKDATAKAYYLFLPCRADMSSVTFSVTHRDGSTSGPYTADFSDDIVSDNEKVVGTTSDYSIIAMQSELPSVMIQIDERFGTVEDMHDDPDHKTYAYGIMVGTVTDEMALEKGWATRYESVDEKADSYCSMKIRGRGNATWGYKKKPYHMVLENKVDLFGMGRATKYVFLANSKDATGGMRTQLAFDMGLLTGVDYTSDHRQVNLFMNGEYLGTYLLAEKAEVGENRVAIDQTDDVFYEKDNYAMEEGIYGFQTEHVYDKTRGFRIISPQDESTLEKSKNKIIVAENMLYGESDYFFEKYFDLESWAKMYLLQQYTMNSDSYYGSLYLYYSSDDGKLHACTPWDFDYSFGVSWGKTDFYVDPMLYDVGGIEWIKPMLTHDNFIVAVLDAYYKGGVRDVICTMPDIVKGYEKANKEAVLMDTVINSQNYYPDYVDDYESAVDYLISICEGRIEFMDQKMEQFASRVGYDING